MSGNGRTKKPAKKKKSDSAQSKHKTRKPISLSLKIAKKI